MQLTEEELKNIKPGIYRTDHLWNENVPRIIKDNRVGNNIVETLTSIIEDDSILFPSNDDTPIHRRNDNRTFFPSSKSFLDTWMDGYREGESQFGENKFYNNLGFELFYVNWHEGSDYFSIPESIGTHNGISIHGDSLDTIMICSDINGMCDQSGYMNLGVNDFRNQKVLIYRAKGENDGQEPYQPTSYSELPDKTKQLRDDLNFYLWDGKERFPFNSANPGKSGGSKWHTIGISPLEIYAELEKKGFVFP